jgi:hypothetical protein
MNLLPISSLYRHCVFMVSAALLAIMFASTAAAQTTKSQVCQMQAPGLVLGAKTWRELKMPKDVGLQQMGLKSTGPRYKMADLAYTSLAAGKAESVVTLEVQSLCMTFDVDSILDDEPLVAAAPSENAVLCSDLATSVSSATEEAAEHNYAFDYAMSPFLKPDNLPQPHITKAVKAALDLSKRNSAKSVIAQTIMDYCEKLKPEEKAALGKEFYAE